MTGCHEILPLVFNKWNLEHASSQKSLGNKCGDQLLVSLFDITNIYINVLYKDIIIGSAHVTLFDIKNLYKQDAVSVTRLQFNEGLEMSL